VRNFSFNEINTLKVCPQMPYHDPSRPFVRYWFASSNGSHVHPFCETLKEANIDRLVEEGGACILYTHFGCNFAESNKVNSRVKEILTYLSHQNGWFVPVSQLLDHLGKTKGHHNISTKERMALERRWLWETVKSRI
jgi:hypothetical protein